MYDDKLCFSRQKSLCTDIVTGLPTILYFCYVYLKTFYMQCECEIPGEHFTEIVLAKKEKLPAGVYVNYFCVFIFTGKCIFYMHALL